MNAYPVPDVQVVQQLVSLVQGISAKHHLYSAVAVQNVGEGSTTHAPEGDHSAGETNVLCAGLFAVLCLCGLV